MKIDDYIRQRRSIYPKQFIPGEKVDDAIVKQMLENANWAPNHHLTEPWRFRVYTGTALQQLADLFENIYRTANSSVVIDESKIEKMRNNPLRSSHAIAIGLKRHADKLPEFEEIAAVACAVQNMYLTISAYEGVGGFWSTGGVTNIPTAKAHFGLEETDKLMGFFYLGKYEGPRPEGHRKPIDGKVEWFF
ncbi:MAG: nitroreductase [Chitinophagales bacterium]|nr:nitroreductase [Chitinophagales bacterium]